MSKEERHQKFKAAGWQYDGVFKFLGGLVIEVWSKVNDVRYWTNAEKASGTATMRSHETDATEDSLDVLVGTTVPKQSNGHATLRFQQIVRDVLTPSKPFFVGAESRGAILKGATCSKDDVLAMMSRMAKDYGRPIVLGPLPYRDQLRSHAERLNERWGMGYYFIPVEIEPDDSPEPKRTRDYRTPDLLNGRVKDDDRAVLPMKYYNHRRAAVRREALTNAFDACYDDLQEVLRADLFPDRMHVIAETPEYVIFGEPGFGDKLEQEYGVRP